MWGHQLWREVLKPAASPFSLDPVCRGYKGTTCMEIYPHGISACWNNETARLREGEYNEEKERNSLDLLIKKCETISTGSQFWNLKSVSKARRWSLETHPEGVIWVSLDITKELGDDVKHRTLLPRQFRGLSWGSLEFQCGAKFCSKLFINDSCHDWCVHMPGLVQIFVFITNRGYKI